MKSAFGFLQVREARKLRRYAEMQGSMHMEGRYPMGCKEYRMTWHGSMKLLKRLLYSWSLDGIGTASTFVIDGKAAKDGRRRHPHLHSTVRPLDSARKHGFTTSGDGLRDGVLLTLWLNQSVAGTETEAVFQMHGTAYECYVPGRELHQ